MLNIISYDQLHFIILQKLSLSQNFHKSKNPSNPTIFKYPSSDYHEFNSLDIKTMSYLGQKSLQTLKKRKVTLIKQT